MAIRRAWVEYTGIRLIIDLVEKSTGKVAFRSLDVDDVTRADPPEKRFRNDGNRLLRDLP
jgi:hypothetical protein